MQRPEFIIFDYGGTLLTEPETDFLLGEREVFKYIKENPRNASVEEVHDFGMKLFLDARVCRDLGFEIHEWQLLKTKYEHFGIEFSISYPELEKILWDAACPTEKPEPGIADLLLYLKSENIRTGVLSNIGWSGEALKYRIDRFLPNNGFEFVIASSDYGIRKPKPEIFKVALSKTGLPPSLVWHVGDSFECDVIGARSVGITPVYYTKDQNEKIPEGILKTDSFEKLHALISELE